jgi:rod shape determining protein RodA
MKKTNWRLILILVILSLIGIIALATLAELGSPTKIHLIKRLFYKQLALYFVGGLVMLGLVLPNYLLYRKFGWAFYFIVIFMLVGVLVFGTPVRGVRRWLCLGPLFIQPTEFMKLAVVILMARLLMYHKTLYKFKSLLPIFLIAIIPMGLVLLQPDLSSALIILLIPFVMLYCAGAKLKHLVIIVLVFVLILPLGYGFLFREYQKERLQAYLGWQDGEGLRNYQREQSIKAIGAGGFSGSGFGMALFSGPNFVPIRHSDLIFSLICEQGGFLGATLVLLCFVGFIYQCLLIAYNTREPFGRLLVIGLTTFISTSTIVNVGMSMGFLPITGIPLPFISQGGSSLVTNFAAAGIIINVGLRWVPVFAGSEFKPEKVEIGTVVRKT